MHTTTTKVVSVCCALAALAGAGLAGAAAAAAPQELPVRAFALLPEGFRYPESIAWDPATRQLYVGSFDALRPQAARDNRILRLDAHGALAAQKPLGSTPLTGLAFHEGHIYFLDFAAAALRRLPADFSAQTPAAEVARFPRLKRPSPGERRVANPDGSEDRIRYGAAGVAVNGLTFRAGDAYVTDSFQGAIFVVRDAARCAPCAPELLIQHPLLATAGPLPFGANGLAFDDEDRLYVNNAGDDRVLRVDLQSKSAHVFAERIHGADGLLFHAGLLWVAANQADAMIALNSAGRVAARAGGFRGIGADGAPQGLLFPAAGAVVDGRMVVANLALPLTERSGDEWEEAVTRWNLAQFDLPLQTSGAEAQTQFIDVAGSRIAFRRIGAGPPILLANRLRGTLDTWDPLFLDALAAQHSVISFDYPGIGYSTGALPDDIGQVAVFVDALAKALDIDRFALLGWSWGGLVAQAYLTDFPGRATHGILLATNPPGRNEIPLQPAFLERAVKPVNDLADEEVLFFEPASPRSLRAAQASHARIYARPGVAARIPATPEQFAPYFRAAQGFHADPPGRRGKMSTIATPLLVISGDNDPSTAGQNWFPLVGKLEDARFVFFSRTGHAPQHQHPRRVAAAISDFLAEDAQPEQQP